MKLLKTYLAFRTIGTMIISFLCKKSVAVVLCVRSNFKREKCEEL